MEYIEPASLRPFVAVVREKSFVRAARALRVQQPAISKAVRALEERLGVILLRRSKSGAALTPAGERVYERCLRIFDELSLMASEASAARGELSGDLWLSTNDHVAAYLLPRALAELRRTHPRAIPRVVTGATYLMIPELLAGRHDLGIFFKIEPTPRLSRTTIARAKCQLLVAPGKRADPATLASFIGSREVDDLANKDFPTLRMLKRDRPETRITLSCSSLEAHKHLVREGCGISILPLFVAHEELAAKTLVRYRPDFAFWADLQLITRRGHDLSPLAQAFLRATRAAFTQNPHLTVPSP
jgi:DNA-binding transcriptional LysR family regulator